MIRIFSILCFITLTSLVFAAQHINVVSSEKRISINGRFEYFEDPSGKMGLTEVMDADFELSNKKDPSFGLTSSTYWLRFDLNIPHVNEDLYKLELSNTLIDEIILFYPQNEHWIKQKAGRVHPFGERKYRTKSFVFDLPNDGVTRTYYLKVKSLYTLAFPIEVARLSEVMRAENDNQILFGAIFGLMFLIAMYNFMMYIFVKEKASLLYGIYILVFAYYNTIFVGVDVQYLYTESVYWPKISASVFAAMSVFVACYFSKVFLNTKEHTPWLDKALLGMMIVATVLFVIPFFHLGITYKKVITLFPATIFIPILWAAAQRTKQRFAPGKLFMLGWTSLFFGILLYGLRSAEVLPSNVFTAYAIPIGAVGEMIILSVSVTYKFKIIKDENDKAKEEKIKHLEEMEALQDKVNRELEQKVEERTKEVLKQKEELAVKNRHITDSINYARRIQVSILPDSVHIDSKFEEFFVFYKPKDIVSGDFYWFSADEDRILIAAADCTGHGVPGALMSILGQSYLGDIVGENNVTDPALVLNRLHAKVTGTLKQGEGSKQSTHDGMDIALAKIQFEPLQIEFAGAKRPIWLIRNDEFYEVKGSRYPIGGSQYERRVDYESVTVPLESGDNFYMFSDGYADQFGGEHGKKFMVRNFKNLIMEIKDLPMNEQNRIIKERFYSWKGDFEQIDDVLVIGARV